MIILILLLLLSNIRNFKCYSNFQNLNFKYSIYSKQKMNKFYCSNNKKSFNDIFPSLEFCTLINNKKKNNNNDNDNYANKVEVADEDEDDKIDKDITYHTLTALSYYQSLYGDNTIDDFQSFQIPNEYGWPKILIGKNLYDYVMATDWDRILNMKININDNENENNNEIIINNNFHNQNTIRKKWTLEEVDYSNKLVEDFINGRLADCKNGQTLRNYLSIKLNRSATSIYVKLLKDRNDNINGKVKYNHKSDNNYNDNNDSNDSHNNDNNEIIFNAILNFKNLYNHVQFPSNWRVPLYTTASSSDSQSQSQSQSQQTSYFWDWSIRGKILKFEVERLCKTSLKNKDYKTIQRLSSLGIQVNHNNNDKNNNNLNNMIIIESATSYKNIKNHLDIPTTFIIPCESPWPYHLWGFPLGDRIKKIRNNDNFLINDEFKKQLIELGVNLKSKSKGGFRLFFKALLFYKNVYSNNNDLHIPSDFIFSNIDIPLELQGYKLGLAVQNTRSGKSYNDDKKHEELNKIGFIWDSAYIRSFEAFIQALIIFRRAYGHLVVPKGFQFPTLLNSNNNDNNNYYYNDTIERPTLSQAWVMEFELIDKTGRRSVNDLNAYPLGEKVQEYRKKWQKGLLSQKQMNRLDNLGFVWGSNNDENNCYRYEIIDNDNNNININNNNRDSRGFDSVLEGLCFYKKLFGHVNVETTFVIPAQDPWPRDLWRLKLGKRLAEFRRKNRTSTKKENHLVALSQIGWTPNKVPYLYSFPHFYQALLFYKSIYGNYQIPTHFKVPINNDNSNKNNNYDVNNNSNKEEVYNNIITWPEELQGMCLGTMMYNLRTRQSKFSRNKKQLNLLKDIGIDLDLGPSNLIDFDFNQNIDVTEDVAKS